MEEQEESLENLLKKYKLQVEEKLSSFTASDYSAYNGNGIQIPTFSQIKTKDQEFIKSFEDSVPLFNTNFFQHQTEENLQKIICYHHSKEDTLHDINIFISQLHYNINEITKRMKRIPQILAFSNKYSLIQCIYSKRLHEAEFLKIKLLSNSKSLDIDDLRLAFYIQFRNYQSNFPLNLLIKYIRTYPYNMHNEIFLQVSNLISNDLESLPYSLNQAPSTNQELRNEIERLTSVLKINCPLDSHDGHEFFYNCNLLFSKLFSNTQKYPSFIFENQIKTSEMQSLIDLINSYSYEQVKINFQIKQIFSDIATPPNAEYIQNLCYSFSIRISKLYGLPKDYLSMYFKMEYIRNCTLFSNIFQIYKKIESYFKQFFSDIEDEQNEVFSSEKQFQLLILKIMSVLSLNIPKDGFPEYADEYHFVELILNLSEQFCSNLEKLAQIFCDLSYHCDRNQVYTLLLKYMTMLPIIIPKSDIPWQRQFLNRNKLLEEMGNVMRSLLSLQIIYERQNDVELFSNSDFLNNTTEIYQNSSSSFCLGIFEIYPSLSKILQFPSIIHDVVSEFCDIHCIDSLIFQDYIEYAIWKFLNSEIHNTQSPISPYSFISPSINSCFEESTGKFLCESFFQSFQFFNQTINSLQESQKLQFAKRCQELLYYGRKLILILYQSAYLKINKNPISFLLPLEYKSIKDFLINGDLSILSTLTTAHHQLLISQQVYSRCLLFIKSSRCVNVDKRIFISVNLFTNWNGIKEFGSLCNGQTVPTSGEDGIIAKTIELSGKYEIAFLRLLEIKFFSRITRGEHCDIFEPLGDQPFVENNSIRIFTIPTFDQIFNIQASPDALQTAIKIMSFRLKLLYYSQFEILLSGKQNKIFLSLFSKNLQWHSSFFGQIALDFNISPSRTSKLLDMTIVSHIFEKYVILIPLNYALCFVQGLDSLYQRKARMEIGQGAQAISYIKELQNSYCSSFRKIFAEIWYPGKSMILRRYVPKFWQNGLNGLPDSFRNEIIEQSNTLLSKTMESLQIDKNNKNIVLSQIDDEEKSSKESFHSISGGISFEDLDILETFLRKQLNHYQLKFALHHLVTKTPFQSITPISAVSELNEEDSELGIVEYQNRVVSKVNQRISDLNKKADNKSFEDQQLKEQIDNGIFSQNSYKAGQKHSREIEIKFLDDCQTLLEEAVYDLVFNQLMNNIQEDLNESLSSLQDAVSSPSVFLKPDFAKNSKAHKQLYLPIPVDIANQFDRELKFLTTHIIYAILDALKHSETKKDSDITYNLKTLEKYLHQIQLNFSTSQLSETWSKYIATQKVVLGQKIEQDKMLDIYRIYHKSLLTQNLQIDIAKTLTNYILKLNVLNDIESRMKADERKTTLEMTIQIQEYFEQLLSDLRNEIKKVKMKYHAVQSHLFDSISRTVGLFMKVHPDKILRFDGNIGGSISVQEELSENIPLDDENHQSYEINKQGEDEQWLDSVDGDEPNLSLITSQRLSQAKISNQKDEDIINQEIEDLRKESIKMRIYRCIEKQGVCNLYKDKIKKAINERRSENSILWHGKRTHEDTVRILEQSLADSYSRLTKAENDIERLKLELEDSQKISIKEVHQQGLIIKHDDLEAQEIHELQAKLKSDANVSELLKKLTKASEELDELEAENDAMEEKIEQTIREPLKANDGFRRKLIAQQIKNRNELYEQCQIKNQQNVLNQRISKLAQFQEENEKLRKTNEELKAQINELLKKKTELNSDIQQSLDTIFDPVDPKNDIRITRNKKIVKPVFPSKIYHITI